MNQVTYESLRNRLKLARLQRKLSDLYKQKQSLTDPEVIALSRKMDQVVVEIMKAEGNV